MSKSNSPLLFKRELDSLVKLIESKAPRTQVKNAIAALRQQFRETKFATEADRAEAGKSFGTVHLLWVISEPAPSGGHALRTAA